ncbi:PRKR-interacting protein 1 isoform X1 [Meriones unguiculatus]|uniref:PRKR-interacting protein 1 isoform X1 n=1 Tax=Meriones unguiculatus TaxID=10047 RepID=UPI001088BC1E|nr:PRKR-interacting protein 1 isoform X1 [Meriones unguiculatus]
MASPAATSVRPPRPKKEPQTLVIPKNAAEEQKLKLERLMKNPDKAVPIPEKMNEWAPRPPPEFVRDVMGSSAGAGSGEFHVYRHLRRREYQRQDYMDAMAEKQKLDAEFQKRLEKNKIAAEEQTAKRRKKRTQSVPGTACQQLRGSIWNRGGGRGAQHHHGPMRSLSSQEPSSFCDQPQKGKEPVAQLPDWLCWEKAGACPAWRAEGPS